MTSGVRVVCAGDRFIRAAALAGAARDAIGGDVEAVEIDSAWPDQPYRSVDGVREAAGDPADLVAALRDGDGARQVLLTHLAPVTAQVLTAADSLAAVGITRGGPVNADLAAASAAGVPVIYLPGRNLGAVAEFTVGVMIAAPRGIARASRTLAAGTWDPRYFRDDVTGPELRTATVGLVGLGAVGQRVAKLLHGFGTRVLGYDPWADRAALADAGVEPVELADLLAASDIVSLHARLTDDTRAMFDDARFAAMKPGAYFVNTARGELVDQDALLAALDSGQLGGAALDVFDPEPPRPDDPLLAHPDVVATPHLAGASRQVAAESAVRVANEVARYLTTGEITNCANPDWREHAAARP